MQYHGRKTSTKNIFGAKSLSCLCLKNWQAFAKYADYRIFAVFLENIFLYSIILNINSNYF